MDAPLIIEETVGGDGTIVLRLTPGARVRIQIESLEQSVEIPSNAEGLSDDELSTLLTDEFLDGLGLTAGEIADSPEFGAWSHRTDIQDGASYVEQIRSRRRYTW